MPEHGKTVVTDTGKRGVLSSGKVAVFDQDGECTTCCGCEPEVLASETTNSENSRQLILDWAPLVQAVLADIRASTEPGVIAARFHNALVEAMVTTAQTVAEPVVALSGGCFQNRLLTERAIQRLQETGFEVLLHRQVPANDGGISLGQIAVAASRLKTH